MTPIRTHAALLMAMLPALATRSLSSGDPDTGFASDAGKVDPVRTGGSTGRAGVLELLESGMISTEEALDLLDGIDQSGVTNEPPPPGPAPRRPIRPVRPVRSVRPTLDPLDSELRSEREVNRAEKEARRAEKEANRAARYEERDARRAAAHERIDTGVGGKRTFRIQVNDAKGSKVNLALPIGFLDTGLKVAERFSPGLLDGAVGNSIRRAVSGGQAGTIIEVDDGAGQHVRIAIE